MLDNIKSLYFIRKLLSYIKEKKKLELIIYNKNIQKNFDIDITNYKFLSGRYKIVDKNRKGQEFYGSNDVLAFEGEYKNGKRNGKGKEYNINGNLIFEGEYKNGKRNGKGKEYSTDGDLIFEGEYKNGKRNGKGQEKEKNYALINIKNLKVNIETALDGLGLNMIMMKIL